MDSNLTRIWVSFFTAAGIPSDVSATYALTFTENRIQNDMLLDLNKEYLRDMGITRMGDVIAILRHAKLVHESTARDRVLSTAVTSNKVPVAAVTGRTTAAQPSSPASRILEHYTRNPPPETTSPPQLQQKRKLSDPGSSSAAEIKKSRLIRFCPTPQAAANEVVTTTKHTVFSRLGNTEASKTVTTVKTTPAKPEMKPIYARLGNKPAMANEQAMPLQKDALKYEGILKNDGVPKKIVTVTTSSNNIRKIAMGCTMRADETPVSVKDKLELPKSKSVKFSNEIEYKEIESIKKVVVKPKFTPVFNKPERRLSMPDSANNVKARLGTKNINNLTITKNIFNRLGV